MPLGAPTVVFVDAVRTQGMRSLIAVGDTTTSIHAVAAVKFGYGGQSYIASVVDGRRRGWHWMVEMK